jgi:hypothetical protein
MPDLAYQATAALVFLTAAGTVHCQTPFTPKIISHPCWCSCTHTQENAQPKHAHTPPSTPGHKRCWCYNKSHKRVLLTVRASKGYHLWRPSTAAAVPAGGCIAAATAAAASCGWRWCKRGCCVAHEYPDTQATAGNSRHRHERLAPNPQPKTKQSSGTNAVCQNHCWAIVWLFTLGASV